MLQRRGANDCPMIETIDPSGPAANTSICVGDTLLEVNGVSANAPQLVLRKALQAATDVAVLKVMRANADPVRSAGRYNVPLKPAMAVKMATKKEELPFWGLFGCCSANRPAVAA